MDYLVLFYFNTIQIIRIRNHFINKNDYSTISEEQKTIALIIIRQSLSEKPLSLVLTEKDPGILLSQLKASYEGTGPVLRQQLYPQFHQLKFENYKTTIQVISEFEDILTRLEDC